MTRQVLRVGVLLYGLLVAGIVFAIDMATESTQAATLGVLEFVRQAEEALEEVVDQVREFEEMAGQRIEDEVWENLPGVEDLVELFETIEAVMEEGETLTRTGEELERIMRERFKSYEFYYGKIVADGGLLKEDFVTRYRQWSETHQETVRNVLKAHNLRAADVDTSAERLALLQEKSKTAEGRMQALQIGQQIAVEEIKQLENLKAIIAEQSDMHASYFLTKQTMEAQSGATSEYLLDPAGETVLDDGERF